MRSSPGKIIFLLVLGSLGKAFAADMVAPTKAEVEVMYSRAAHELNAGNYSETLQQLDALDSRQPDVAAAQNLRGVALMRMGEFGPAEKALQKARELDPDLWEARFNLAEVPFLARNWSEARDRFTALADSFPAQAEGATGELIQFKILLTYLLQNKQKNATALIERLKSASMSPALYYAQAAWALWQKDESGAKVNFRAAEKAYSAKLNRLFLESFYEIGWLTKPEQGSPATLEVISEATRVTNAQADFGNAERAFRRGELDRALELLKSVDATAPNQAVSYNLRGEILLEQGNLEGAQGAFHNALEADPQLQEARLNLARIPFKKGDYETARKELESLFAASSGGKRQTTREQLIRYQIFLTLLRENREGAAQKAMEDFKMTDESPALYYAQAAWAYQHGNPTQGEDWIANANNLFSAEMNRDFARPLNDLGWSLNRNESRRNEPTKNEAETKSKAVVTPSSTAPPAVVPQERSPSNGAMESATPAPAPSPKEHPSANAPSETPAPSSSPKARPEKSAKKSARGEADSSAEKRERTGQTATDRSARAKTAGKVGRSETRESQNRGVASAMPSSQLTTSGTPVPTSVIHENLGDKVRNLLLYPFQRREKTTPRSGTAGSAAAPGPTGSPIPR